MRTSTKTNGRLKMSLFAEVTEIVNAEHESAGPLPVDEGVCVRVPSWFDGRMAWQGVTFMRRGEKVRLQCDDGRAFERASAADAWAAWHADDSSLWAYEISDDQVELPPLVYGGEMTDV